MVMQVVSIVVDGTVIVSVSIGHHVVYVVSVFVMVVTPVVIVVG